ncbi:hypothetical protein CEXT_284201 [Caerostris extrusa]|uniref:Uncharacterized protein n=1 Tax=Caerostris extrusa TaxID=172846 RepID=A0AAV4XLW4_CAEEX|nr:hypothetical protein CEXT_284201 [Caerostris extrusa]
MFERGTFVDQFLLAEASARNGPGKSPKSVGVENNRLWKNLLPLPCYLRKASTSRRWIINYGANQSPSGELRRKKLAPGHSLIMPAEKRHLHGADGANHLTMRHHTSKISEVLFCLELNCMARLWVVI